MNPTIDIVIPCAGRAADLLRLLASLRRCCEADLREQVASITVTDDRPSESLRAALAADHPLVRYLHGPARGPAANRNNGARAGSAPWLLFLDDDCFMQSNLLEGYRQALQADAQADVLEGAIHPVGERPDGNHHAPLNLQGGLLWSCNMMLRRSTFEAVGGFDESFPFACLEDVDLRERLRERAARTRFAPAAIVYHPWRRISRTEVSRQIISHAIYAEKHRDFARQWSLLHVLRALRGRARLYRVGSPLGIAPSQWRVVVYDVAAPVVCYAVVKLSPLRRALWQRYRNPQPSAA
jgi:GT2 family glycosyltransferase